jgi:hypothetical protein
MRGQLLHRGFLFVKGATWALCHVAEASRNASYLRR